MMIEFTNDDVRKAGGIVHKDGNVFFANIDILNRLIAFHVLPLDEKLASLHGRLAAETLRADQGWQRYESANADRNALRAAKAAPVPAASEGWISVDERMPAEGAHVLIAYWPYNNRENEQAVMDVEYHDGTFYTDGDSESHPPSHWMPWPIIPAAPATSDKAEGV